MASLQTTPATERSEAEPIRGRRRSMVGPLATAAAVAAGAAVLAVRDPSAAGGYPPCPIAALTGLDCPGCGSTRAGHALLHGDVIAALDHNLLLLPGALLAIWLWAAWFTHAATGRRLPVLRATPVVTVVAAGIVAAFTVARNLPGLALLAA